MSYKSSLLRALTCHKEMWWWWQWRGNQPFIAISIASKETVDKHQSVTLSQHAVFLESINSLFAATAGGGIISRRRNLKTLIKKMQGQRMVKNLGRWWKRLNCLVILDPTSPASTNVTALFPIIRQTVKGYQRTYFYLLDTCIFKACHALQTVQKDEAFLLWLKRAARQMVKLPQYIAGRLSCSTPLRS
jgi:hypothetical protein